MLPYVYLRILNGTAARIAEAGIPTSHPVGGTLFGTLSLPKHQLVLRVDIAGRATLFDPKEGTPNFRIPKKSWLVNPDGHGWPDDLARGVVEHLIPQEWRFAIGPDGPVQASDPPVRLEVNRFGGGRWSDGMQVKCGDRVNRWRGRGQHGGDTGDINRAKVLLHTFYGSPPTSKHRPVFRDGNRENFQVENLMWATTGAESPLLPVQTAPPVVAPSGLRQKKAPKLKDEVVDQILNLCAAGLTDKEIAERICIIRSGRGTDIVRVQRVIQGGHFTRGVWENLYIEMKGALLDVRRRAIIEARDALGVADTTATTTLRERLHNGVVTTSRRGMRGIKVEQDVVLNILSLLGDGKSQVEMARETGVYHATVRKLVEGQIHRGKGRYTPCRPEFDDERRVQLFRRDQLGLPDTTSTRNLRMRLAEEPSMVQAEADTP